MPRALAKIPVDVIIKRIEKIHGDVITLDKSTYVNTKTKARFIDKKFGAWWASPSNILQGNNHKKRGKIIPIEVLKRRIHEIHGTDIMIDEKTYINTLKNAFFMDKDFGRWQSVPHRVLQGCGHPKRGFRKAAKSNSLKIEIVQQRLLHVHGNQVTMDASTYESIGKKAKFIDRDYGEWWATPKNILNGHGHIARKLEKMRKTCLERFGVQSPQQNKEIALRTARTQNKITDVPYWENKELIPCHGGYETRTVQRWNEEKEKFNWQIVFNIPETVPLVGGLTYRIDAYLPNKDLYVEIKGRFYDEESRLKWEWFHRAYPNSELWGEDKLKELGIIQ